jgi:ribosomal-protein-alanine N-acetyltransferase
VADCPQLRTERLLLRRWSPEDRAAFAAVNGDPRVMEFLGGPLTRERSDVLADWIEAGFRARNYGFWAIEAPGVASFVGIAGLGIPRFDAPFMPAVEVGWRLDPAYWGRGYATEAAHAAIAHAFEAAGLDEVVAFTVSGNVRSRRVMERAGMVRDAAGDFEHPLIEAASPLRRHVLYRIRRAEYRARLADEAPRHRRSAAKGRQA